MGKNYDELNYKNKGIKKINSIALSELIQGLDIYSNCLISGGLDIRLNKESINIINRKVVICKYIERLIGEYPNSIIIFHKSKYIKKRFKSKYKNRDGITFIDIESRCFKPFLSMSKEEIIYSIKSIGNVMRKPVDQYAETYLEYLLNIIYKSGYEINYENIMILINESNEHLSMVANNLGLLTESKYFSKQINGSEIIKRILKEFDSYIESIYQLNTINQINICSEIKKGNVIFIQLDDQYQNELLEYYFNEIKIISHYNPFIIFEDIMLKDNQLLEKLLLKSTGIRYCISSIDIAGCLSDENFEYFRAQTPIKILLHYDDVNSAERISSSVGFYYHYKVTVEESRNREAMNLTPLKDTVTKGNNITEEKREVIEGNDLINLKEHQLFLIHTSLDKILFKYVEYEI